MTQKWDSLWTSFLLQQNSTEYLTWRFSSCYVDLVFYLIYSSVIPMIQIVCQSAAGGLNSAKRKGWQAFSESLPARTLIIPACVHFHPITDHFFFFNFTILYWFCQISKWIRHRYTCVPHPEPSSLFPPHSIPLGRPSAPAPSIQYCALNLD